MRVRKRERGRGGSERGKSVAALSRGAEWAGGATTHLVVPRDRLLHVAALVLDDAECGVRARRARVELDHLAESGVRLVPLPARA